MPNVNLQISMTFDERKEINRILTKLKKQNKQPHKENILAGLKMLLEQAESKQITNKE
jgi:hypothetical protein